MLGHAPLGQHVRLHVEEHNTLVQCDSHHLQSPEQYLNQQLQKDDEILSKLKPY